MTKPDLRRWLQKEYEQWQALLDEVGMARMEVSGVNGDWSMKDMLAHLAVWNLHLVNRFQAAVRGEQEPAPPWPGELQTDDEINAWIYESSRGRSVREVLDESQQSLQQLLAIIESLPADARVEHIDPDFYLVWIADQRYTASEFFNHFHDDHESDVRLWLERVNAS